DGDAGVGPVPADAPDQATEKLADLHTRRRLARTQDDRNRSTRRLIIDMDRQEAALIIVGVPLRQLLVAVHNINRVVDVQDNRPRWLLVTSAPDIDQSISKADDLPQRRRILPARDSRLRAKITAGSRPHASLKAASRRSQSKSLPSGY